MSLKTKNSRNAAAILKKLLCQEEVKNSKKNKEEHIKCTVINQWKIKKKPKR